MQHTRSSTRSSPRKRDTFCWIHHRDHWSVYTYGGTLSLHRRVNQPFRFPHGIPSINLFILSRDSVPTYRHLYRRHDLSPFCSLFKKQYDHDPFYAHLSGCGYPLLVKTLSWDSWSVRDFTSLYLFWFHGNSRPFRFSPSSNDLFSHGNWIFYINHKWFS